VTGNVTLARPTLLPVSLEAEPGEAFKRQLAELQRLSTGLVDWRPPAFIGDRKDGGVTAVVVPDMSGLAYRLLKEFRQIEVPILVITSEFGTVSMWDWESGWAGALLTRCSRLSGLRSRRTWCPWWNPCAHALERSDNPRDRPLAASPQSHSIRRRERVGSQVVASRASVAITVMAQQYGAVLRGRW
jgi:hypothetical protein